MLVNRIVVIEVSRTLFFFTVIEIEKLQIEALVPVIAGPTFTGKFASLRFLVTFIIVVGGTVIVMQGSKRLTVNTLLAVEGPFQE